MSPRPKKSPKPKRRPDTWYSAGGGIGRRGQTTWGFWDSDAKRYVKAGTTKAEAIAAQAEYRARRARGERPVVQTKVSFAELAEQWFESKRVGAWTKRSYRDALDNVLLPRFGDWQVAAVDADAIATLIRDLEREGLHAIDATRPKRPLSASSITNYCKPLSGVLSLAVRRRLIGSNPYRVLTSDERPQQQGRRPAHEWSEEEIEALLTAATKLAARRDAKTDYTPILKVAIECGLRLGELLGLEWADIDLDERVLRVERQWTLTGELTTPKTKAGIRRVPLGGEMVSFFRQLRLASKHSLDTDPVFASKTGGRLRHRNVQRRAFEAARDLAGLPEELRFHDMRHAFASRCASRGVPIGTLSSVLGHADVSITQRVYVALYDRASAEEAFRAAMSS